MTSRTILPLVLAAFLAGMSWLSIAAGVPTVISPLNLVVLLPGLFARSVLGRAWFPVSITVVPVTFWLWCRPVFRGSPFAPIRSFVLLGGFFALSAIALGFGADFAVQYQGRDYFVGVVVIEITWWLVLGLLAVVARRSPQPGINLLFHVALFTWLSWYAIPYMGELP